MQYQLKKGSFVPEKFEVSFSVLEELDAVNIALSEQEKMRLRGRIDRVDMKEDREHVYVKVVDYKSGSREFSLAALYYGLQPQLVVYMNAAMEIAGKKHPEKEIVPAAMLYYRVQDPMIEMPEGEPSAEEVNAQVLRALRTTGIVNAREDVVEGLDQGFLGRSAAFRRVRVFWKRRIFRRYRHLWSRKSGRRDDRFWMEKSHWTRMSRATETPANTARTRKCADLTKRSTGL